MFIVQKSFLFEPLFYITIIYTCIAQLSSAINLNGNQKYNIDYNEVNIDDPSFPIATFMGWGATVVRIYILYSFPDVCVNFFFISRIVVYVHTKFIYLFLTSLEEVFRQNSVT